MYSSWKMKYEKVSFELPPQNDVDNLMVQDKVMIAKGENIKILKVLTPPCGREFKKKGKWKKG